MVNQIHGCHVSDEHSLSDQDHAFFKIPYLKLEKVEYRNSKITDWVSYKVFQKLLWGHSFQSVSPKTRINLLSIEGELKARYSLTIESHYHPKDNLPFFKWDVSNCARRICKLMSQTHPLNAVIWNISRKSSYLPGVSRVFSQSQAVTAVTVKLEPFTPAELNWFTNGCKKINKTAISECALDNLPLRYTIRTICIYTDSKAAFMMPDFFHDHERVSGNERAEALCNLAQQLTLMCLSQGLTAHGSEGKENSPTVGFPWVASYLLSLRKSVSCKVVGIINGHGQLRKNLHSVVTIRSEHFGQRELSDVAKLVPRCNHKPSESSVLKILNPSSGGNTRRMSHTVSKNNNKTFKITDVEKLVHDALDKVTKEDWQSRSKISINLADNSDTSSSEAESENEEDSEVLATILPPESE
ncbi:hypothetical protein J6590_086123 [Homalodisca vitripennis]|nr:hypothetical protein J6590_086123 [Homalodisca vitripennis]